MSGDELGIMFVIVCGLSFIGYLCSWIPDVYLWIKCQGGVKYLATFKCGVSDELSGIRDVMGIRDNKYVTYNVVCRIKAKSGDMVKIEPLEITSPDSKGPHKRVMKLLNGQWFNKSKLTEITK